MGNIFSVSNICLPMYVFILIYVASFHAVSLVFTQTPPLNETEPCESGPMLAACVFKEPCKEGVFKRTTETGGIVVSYCASEQQHRF